MIAVAMVVLTVGVLAVRGAGALAPARSTDVTTALRRGRRPIPLGRARQREPGDAEVAEWCEHLSAAVRGGRSLTQAIADTDAGSPGRPILATVTHAVQRGRALPDALDEQPADPSTGRGLVIPVLRASARLGGPAASAIERVAMTLQARAGERAERRSASAQARLSALVLTVVPFAVLAFLAGTESSVRAALLSPGGLVCVVAGSAMNLTGWWWMGRLIGRAT